MPSPAPTAYAAMMSPSITRNGSPSSTVRAIDAFGSPSSALQTDALGRTRRPSDALPDIGNRGARPSTAAKTGRADQVQHVGWRQPRETVLERTAAVVATIVVE